MVPDTTGAAGGGGTASYTFTAAEPGTYLYEAGLIPGSQYQVAMGLYGALVVRPAGAPAQAYADAATAFDDEASSSSARSTRRSTTAPRPGPLTCARSPRACSSSTAPLPASARDRHHPGTSLLLRYVNAGISTTRSASWAAPGGPGVDGTPAPYPRTMVAETLAPGQSARRPGLASRRRRQPPDQVRPVRRGHDLQRQHRDRDRRHARVHRGGRHVRRRTRSGRSPRRRPDGTPARALHGHGGRRRDDDRWGGRRRRRRVPRRLHVGQPGRDGSVRRRVRRVERGHHDATGEIDTSAWTTGTHSIYVRGRDALGNWGAFAVTTITPRHDRAGDERPRREPQPHRGRRHVALSGTASDAATGSSNVTAAEYFIDAVGADGAGLP